MRALIQRSLGASVSVVQPELEQDAEEEIAAFDGEGLTVLLGVCRDDDAAVAAKIAEKIAHLRVLDGERSVLQAQAPVLLVSQFTLYGQVARGRRPSWSRAAAAAVAEDLYEEVAGVLRGLGVRVGTGAFGEHMRVRLCNDGPFTIWLDSADLAG